MENVVTAQPVRNTPQPELPEATAETPLSISEEMREAEEERKRREDCCCYYIPDDEDVSLWCWLCRCIADCCYGCGQCTDSGFEDCAVCCNGCCESSPNVETGGDSDVGCLECCSGDGGDCGGCGDCDCSD